MTTINLFRLPLLTNYTFDSFDVAINAPLPRACAVRIVGMAWKDRSKFFCNHVLKEV